jgi:hypothetical protein
MYGRDVFGQTKHFLVSRMIRPDLPIDPIESVGIEAVFSQAAQIFSWRSMKDDKVWGQG